MSDEKPTPQQLDLSGAEWLRSPDSPPDADAVEIAFVGEFIAMRKANDPTPPLIFTQGEWDAFVLGAKDGEFDIEVA
ncbi:DUF397 domain-containing protein [Allonocardiopsis opalescens]|uniref:Uncharacterized protein DUF397 n=1 Tax=Allonocardiopsis opalescens TaxID=1144618 RepID=A0A2T0QDN3_9ACTN|nr:DUF397 domain-containing protein [Allonocardiopsis opalescens]PRY02002.1 uncharacterized protein DUF397 [Allonocardiopsis opalescens]